MKSENLPILEAIVEFLSEDKGGRSLQKGLLTSEQYRYCPHLVIGDVSQRQSVFAENHKALEQYLGVQFCDGPEQLLPGVPVVITIKLLYYPQELYENLLPGTEFTIREGPKIVGYGQVTRWIQKAS